MKKIITAAALLLTSLTYAQPYLSMEAGNRMGINAGMIYKNIEIKAGGLIPYTRRSDVSFLSYIATGYKFGNEITVTPLLGVAQFHVVDFSHNKDGLEVNKTILMKSLEIGHDFTARSGMNCNIYLFINKASELYAGAGLKFFIQ